MTVALTPAEGQQKIDEINQARDQAVQKLNQISDTQQEMLASNWTGGSASTYNTTSQQQREEFDDLISTLNATVDKGAEHIRAVANMDQS